MISSEELDRETLIFVIDMLDYQYHFLKDLRDGFDLNQEEFTRYDQRLNGIRQAINKIEEYI